MLSKNSHSLRIYMADLAFLVAGNVCLAMAVSTFAMNAGFVPGGLAGIALIFQHYTGLPLGLLTIVLNVPLALLALRATSRSFLLKSIVSMMINAALLDFAFPHIPSYTGNPLLAAGFTGVLLGVGSALTFLRGASGGGMDFLIMFIRKHHPHISMGSISLAVQVAVTLSGGLVFKSVDAVLYAIVCGYACTVAMDRILHGVESGIAVFVVTGRGRDIAGAIEAVPRGSTILSGVGGHTGDPKDVLLCFCSKNQVARIRTVIRQTDPESMVMTCNANEVIGNGFPVLSLPGS